MKTNKLVMFVAAVVTFASLSANAVEFVGKAGAGFNMFNEGFGSKFAWDLGVDARITPQIQLGLEYRKVGLGSQDGFDTSISMSLLNAMYRIPAGSNHFAVGFELGQASIDTSVDLGIVSATASSESKFAFGPRVAYEMGLGTNWEAALNVDYLMISSDPKLSALGTMVSIGYRL